MAKRPTPVASDADARPFRSRNCRSLAQNIELLSVLEERKLEADKEEGRTNIRALVRTVILERQPALQHEPKDLLKEVNRCSMLLKRGSNAGTSALGKRIKARSDIGRTKRVRRFDVRRRKAITRKRTPTDVLEELLYQWMIDQLNFGARLYTAQVLEEANLIANDIRVQHESLIEAGERDAGTRVKLPELDGNAGSVWSSRLPDKNKCSWNMTNP